MDPVHWTRSCFLKIEFNLYRNFQRSIFLSNFPIKILPYCSILLQYFRLREALFFFFFLSSLMYIHQHIRAHRHYMKNGVFWDVTLYGSSKNLVFLRSVRRLLVTANVVPSSPILVIWWWRRYVPPKRQFLQEPHGVTSQKTPFFIVTAVKTSKLT
jgi:hypothetical protein